MKSDSWIAAWELAVRITIEGQPLATEWPRLGRQGLIAGAAMSPRGASDVVDRAALGIGESAIATLSGLADRLPDADGVRGNAWRDSPVRVTAEITEPSEAVEAAEAARAITSSAYAANEVRAIWSALGYEESTSLPTFSSEPNKLHHMFRETAGHVPDTPLNRAIIQETARSGVLTNVRGTIDGSRFEIRAKRLPSGQESWSQSVVDARGTVTIQNGGIGSPKYLAHGSEAFGDRR